MLISICYITYSWFLSVFGLMTFKKWITWPWCEGEFAFSVKLVVFGTIEKIISFRLFLSKQPMTMTNFNSKTSKFIGLSFFTLQILNSKSYLRFKSWGSKNRKQPPRLFFKIGFLQLQLQSLKNSSERVHF